MLILLKGIKMKRIFVIGDICKTPDGSLVIISEYDDEFLEDVLLGHELEEDGEGYNIPEYAISPVEVSPNFCGKVAWWKASDLTLVTPSTLREFFKGKPLEILNSFGYGL